MNVYGIWREACCHPTVCGLCSYAQRNISRLLSIQLHTHSDRASHALVVMGHHIGSSEPQLSPAFRPQPQLSPALLPQPDAGPAVDSCSPQSWVFCTYINTHINTPLHQKGFLGHRGAYWALSASWAAPFLGSSWGLLGSLGFLGCFFWPRGAGFFVPTSIPCCTKKAFWAILGPIGPSRRPGLHRFSGHLGASWALSASWAAPFFRPSWGLLGPLGLLGCTAFSAILQPLGPSRRPGLHRFWGHLGAYWDLSASWVAPFSGHLGAD